MSQKVSQSKTSFLVLGGVLLALSLVLPSAFGFVLEFENSKCLTWNNCGLCVVGPGSDIGQGPNICFAAVGGFGNGTAQHCVSDGTTSGWECLYKSTTDPGTLSCFGAAVYLCDMVPGVDQCICECSGSADLSGQTISDTKTCQSL